jgi:hypothetical protein
MASGNSLCAFGPQDNEPTATDFATLDTRNAHPVLDFDASTSERAQFTNFLPRHYSNGGITCTLVWGGTSATTGFVVWRGEFERMAASDIDIDSDSFGTQIAATASCSAAAGQLSYTTLAFTATQLDSLASSGAETFRFKLTRVATATGDTMSGDAELVFMEMRET